MLDTLIPQNYENLNLGINFEKYDEDGLPLSEKQKYDKYLLKETDKVGIIDTYQYVPTKPLEIVDTDINQNQLKTDGQLREVEEALNYDGEEEIYEEMEDDFFAKMIQGQIDTNKHDKKNQEKKPKKKEEVKEVKKEMSKKIPKETEMQKMSQKQMEDQLEKAMYNFQHNIEDKKNSKPLQNE